MFIKWRIMIILIYPGLPVNPDIEEMMMVWEKAEKNNIKLNSPTLLASLLRFFHFYMLSVHRLY